MTCVRTVSVPITIDIRAERFGATENHYGLVGSPIGGYVWRLFEVSTERLGVKDVSSSLQKLTQHSPSNGTFDDYFPFSKGGRCIRSLEGSDTLEN